jgi:hypothetical protein
MTTHDQHTPYSGSDPMDPRDRQDYGTGQAQPSSEYPTQPSSEYPAQQQSSTDYPAEPSTEWSAQPSSESAVQPSSERMAQPGATMNADVAQHDSTAFGSTDADTNRGMTDASAGQPASGGNDHDLFADDELAGLRARWDNVQASFVDDPKECVQKADGLVADLVEQLTRSFSHSRSQLEEQWARGEDASTEDLRITLKHYREFFDRLLAV